MSLVHLRRHFRHPGRCRSRRGYTLAREALRCKKLKKGFDEQDFMDFFFFLSLSSLICTHLTLKILLENDGRGGTTIFFEVTAR